MDMTPSLRQIGKWYSNFHYPDGSPNIFLFAVPRSGSTWLMELLQSQPGFKICAEPFDLRNSQVARHLPIGDWVALYNENNLPVIEAYLEGFINGRYRFKNQSPRRPYYRPVTRRLIFKILHAGEDRINWFRDTFNGQIIYLLRHPIPVTLSRHYLPRLQVFTQSDYHRYFTNAQLTMAAQIMETGSHLQKGVLSWCFQNSVPLRHRTDDWILLTYEQLVLNPKPIITHLTHRLQAQAPQKMWAQLDVPSGTTNQSDIATLSILNNPRTQQNKRWLVEKWREQVDQETEAEVMRLLDLFDISAYQTDSFLPNSNLWLQ